VEKRLETRRCESKQIHAAAHVQTSKNFSNSEKKTAVNGMEVGKITSIFYFLWVKSFSYVFRIFYTLNKEL